MGNFEIFPMSCEKYFQKYFGSKNYESFTYDFESSLNTNIQTSPPCGSLRTSREDSCRDLHTMPIGSGDFCRNRKPNEKIPKIQSLNQTHRYALLVHYTEKVRDKETDCVTYYKSIESISGTLLLSQHNYTP